MLKEHVKIFSKLLIFADICVITAAFSVSCGISEKAGFLDPQTQSFQYLAGTLVMWLSCLYVFGMYSSFRVKAVTEVLFSIIKVALLGLIIPVSVIYLLQPRTFSREFIALTVLLIAVFLSIEKVVLIFIFRHIRRRGLNFRRILIVGTNERARHFIDLVEQHSEWGFRITGFIDEDKSKIGQAVKNYKVLGGFDDFEGIIHNTVVDHVVFVVPRQWFEKIYGLINFCAIEGIPVSVAVDIFELKFARARQSDLHGFPLLTFDSTPDQLWHLLVKRVADIIFSGIFLLIFSPLFALTAFLIKKSSPGPVLFKQERCGLNGRKFIVYKFRTMVQNAEEKLEELRAQNEMQGPVFKMSNDPRITPVGRILRKFSIDEFPQLWNVFKGDMSLVGPRPPLHSEVVKYDNWQRRRLSMKPGLTCLWQTRGRNEISDFDAWMRMDLEYIDNWSLWLDLKLLLKTVPVVLLGKGAK